MRPRANSTKSTNQSHKKKQHRLIDTILTTTIQPPEDQRDLITQNQILKSKLLTTEHKLANLQDRIRVFENKKETGAKVMLEKAARLLFQVLMVIKISQKEQQQQQRSSIIPKQQQQCDQFQTNLNNNNSSNPYLQFLSHRSQPISLLLEPYIQQNNLAAMFTRQAKRVKQQLQKICLNHHLDQKSLQTKFINNDSSRVMESLSRLQSSRNLQASGLISSHINNNNNNNNSKTYLMANSNLLVVPGGSTAIVGAGISDHLSASSSSGNLAIFKPKNRSSQLTNNNLRQSSAEPYHQSLIHKLKASQKSSRGVLSELRNQICGGLWEGQEGLLPLQLARDLPSPKYGAGGSIVKKGGCN